MAEPGAQKSAAQADSPERRQREAAWVQQIALRGEAGSRALRQLIHVYRPKVLTFCIRRGMGRADAEDLLQDLWIRVARHAAAFEQGLNPSSWIWAIARHLWVDNMRKLYRNREDAMGDDLESESEVAQSAEMPNISVSGNSLDDCVHRGLQRYARMHDEGAMAVQLRDLEGWGIAELAQFLGRTETATRTFLSQVRKKLEPFLKPCFELLSN